MARYMLPLPTIAGLLSSQAGQAFTVTTPDAVLTTVRADFTLTDAGAADLVLELASGVATETVTIAAGTKYVSHVFSDTYLAGNPLTLTITSGDGMNLSGLLLVDDVGPASAVPVGIVTLADVKTALGIGSTTSDQVDYLNRQIDLVSERARQYTNRHLNEALHIETFYAPTSILLTGYPVTAISSVTRDGSTLVAADIRADLARGRIWQPSSQGTLNWQGVDKVVVNYTAGYNPMPAGIVEWAYLAIWAGWESFLAGDRVSAGGRTERKLDYPDGGGVEYSLGRTPMLPDWLARAPLEALDPWVDKVAPMSAEYSIYTRI